MKLNKTKGFTLVELLGVVAIIAVLATVSITSISGAVQGGRVAASNRQIQTLNSAYQNYLAAGGSTAETSAANVMTVLQARINLPASNQLIGPFLLATPPDGANVRRANGNVVALNFNTNTGFSAGSLD